MSKATFNDLSDWLRELTGDRNGGTESFFDAGNQFVAITKFETEGYDAGRVYFKLATGRNTYTISARLSASDDGYLGCIATSRKARAGENWLRGSDLPDGPLARETWDRILAAILRYEIVPIAPDTREFLRRDEAGRGFGVPDMPPVHLDQVSALQPGS